MSNLKHTVAGRTLILEREFSVPRQKVWDAFTKPEIFVKWWGPNGWTTEIKEFNFTENGINHYGMKCEDKTQGEWYGKYSWGKMVFSNIKPIISFDYIDYFCDEKAEAQTNLPAATCTQQFLETRTGTKLISTCHYENETALKQVLDLGMLAGITETWDRLAELTKTSQ